VSTFVPQYSFILSISQGQQTVVTFTANCDFIAGEIVSFRVSSASGMRELNNQQTTVTSATSNTITVPINSLNYTPFVFIEPTSQAQPAMVVPAGSGILQGTYPAQTNLQDAFDNVPT
jgi:hypothetical protein